MSMSPLFQKYKEEETNPLAIHGVSVDLQVHDDHVAISATVRTADRTGVEMEALTCVAVAALALIDMVKAVDPGAVIEQIALQEKTGGRRGHWVRDAADAQEPPA